MKYITKSKVIIIASFILGYNFILLHIKQEQTFAKDYQTIEASTSEDINEKEIKNLEYYQNINSDVVMMLILSDRNIPIMNSDEYFRLNIHKEYDSMGTPFIDSISTKRNTIIQGHSSTKNNYLFTVLLEYIEEDYLLENPTFKLETVNVIMEYEIFSVIRVDLEIEEPYLRWYDTHYRNDSDYINYLKEVNELSLIPIEKAYSAEDKIVTLVTCDDVQNNARVIVLAKKKEENRHE